MDELRVPRARRDADQAHADFRAATLRLADAWAAGWAAMTWLERWRLARWMRSRG